jgi:hypothetical protein
MASKLIYVPIPEAAYSKVKASWAQTFSCQPKTIFTKDCS